MNDFTDRMEDMIREHGQIILAISDSPPFAYTIGNVDRDLPELVMLGLDAGTMHAILQRTASAMVERGNAVVPGTYEREIASMPIRMDAVHPSQVRKILLQAVHREERMDRDPSGMKVMQIVWPDPNGIFPDEPGFDPRWGPQQPLLRHPHVPEPQGSC